MLITLICHILLTQQCLPWFITILVFASCGTNGTAWRFHRYIAIVFIVLFPSYVDLKSNNFPLHLLLLSMVFIMNFYWFINSYFNSRKLKLIPLDKILIWCGINSLALLGLHILFVDTFWIVRNKLHLVNYSWTILEFALIVAICYFATTLIKRYIPSVLGRS